MKVALELAEIKIELKYPFLETDEKAKYWLWEYEDRAKKLSYLNEILQKPYSLFQPFYHFLIDLKLDRINLINFTDSA